MRTVCPVCSTTYEVPEALLTPGRAVRCAQCEAQWVACPLEISASSPVPTDNPAFGTSPQPRESHAWTAVERLVSPPAGRPGRSRLIAAWVASIAVVVLLFGWAMISWRPEIIQAWPPSTRLYDMFGLK